MKTIENGEVRIYPYEYVYKGNRTILIWQSSPGTSDSFRLKADNKLVEAKNETELKKILKEDSEKVHWEEKSVIDFDRFWTVIRNMKPKQASSEKTCEIILAGWNFMEDLGRTFGHNRQLKKLRSPLLNKCYDKVFYGNNLLPINKPYYPVWTKEEIVSMKKELKALWSLFLNHNYISGQKR